MFVDKVQVQIAAGDGGNGYVSFRHEKFVDHGGPDGGDGGNGGNVIVVGSNSENTLAKFRYEKSISADSGKPGFNQKKHGRAGKDIYVPLPVGTIVVRDGVVIADLTEPDQEVIVARGGKGGFGNAHFTSSTRQAPRFAEKGEPGDSFDATLELKSIADVGIIGLPNAGKSTLLSIISNAKPEIANYPFTTLIPNLGVATIDEETSILLADIPGLIEGASEGKGLGDEFLRHVERTKVLLHLIDAYSNDVAADYLTIKNELKAYSAELAERPEIVCLTKIEGLDHEIVDDQLKKLKKVAPKNTPLLAISSTAHQGIKELLYKLAQTVNAAAIAEEEKPDDEKVVIKPNFEELSWHIVKTDDLFVVTGSKIERFARRTEFTDEYSLQRLRDIMRKMGISRELIKMGIEAGNRIQIGRANLGTFEY